MTVLQTNWNNEKDKTYPSIYNLETRKLIQIADTQVTEIIKVSNPDYTIGYDENPYLLSSMWEAEHFDLYKINLKTGEKKLIVKYLEESANISPDGKFVVYYKDSLWNVYNTATETSKEVNIKMQYPMYDEEHDTPSKAGSYGFVGWYEVSQKFLVNDRYDIWIFDSEEPQNRASLTASYGRTNQAEYRIRNFDRDKEYFTFNDTLLINGYNTKYKWNNLYFQDFKILGSEKLTYHENAIQKCLTKAKGNHSALMTIENFGTFPDLWFDAKLFSERDSIKRLTDVNPQMKEFYWGSTQPIEWVDTRGNRLQGFIMKPDNFDAKKKYPVLIYYYEKFSDEMFNFQRPSISGRPNPVIYTSDDYVVFFPDIVFTVGNPGYSSVDALTTGAKKLIDMGIADPNAIGLQGHSWSGYQTAFAITQTNMFKAASAGAPVANMTSAYSGIRYGSGLARQFQYEKQQSRIGGTLWDSLDNYIKNSPIFEAKNIKTPLLIEFGDNDDAVPYTQGLELFLGMKRLGKEVFMLQYEKEPHILRKYYNNVDYATKMKEFFDHYLKGKPAPDWMIKGIPFKGN
jgi:dipeptidyl aminopeptidase/acylaminoacyl peptidase